METDVQVLTNNLYSILYWVGGWMILNMILLAIADYAVSDSVPFTNSELEVELTSHLYKYSYQFFSGEYLGGLVAKIKRFIDTQLSFDIPFSRGLLQSFIQLVAAICVLWYHAPFLGLIFLIWGLLFVCSAYFYIKKKAILDTKKAAMDSKVTGQIADTITNVITIKMFATADREREKLKELSLTKAYLLQESWYATAMLGVYQNTFIAFFHVSVLFVSVWLYSQQLVSIGVIVLSQTYILVMSKHLSSIGQDLKDFLRGASRGIETMKLLEQEILVKDPNTPEKCNITKGEISLNNVSFSHTNDMLFESINLHIPAGQKVGVVGHSGSGKSTLTKLLLRFMDVNSGAITIDGQNIKNITQDDLRRNISYVPQDPILFHRSIKQNIGYGKNNVTDEEIISVAKQVYAHDFIAKLPNGYDTIVGERGIKLSGGERQRVAIARAMMKDAPIIMFDEATSSLDSISEKYIQSALDALIKNRTTIVIAHRLSTVQKMDRIIVLDNGCIIEDGTHDELLKKDGVYKELWQHQSDGFIGQ